MGLGGGRQEGPIAISSDDSEVEEVPADSAPAGRVMRGNRRSSRLTPITTVERFKVPG